jgi:hypothetical protein
LWGLQVMSCSYNISIVPKVIHMFDLYLKKKQPPLPLESSVSQGQGGPNDVRSSSPAEERVHIGQKREVLHAATSPFPQPANSTG